MTAAEHDGVSFPQLRNEPIQAVSTEQVLAYRLHRHGLDRRVSVGELHRVAGACGIQNSPPRAAELALHARVRGLTSQLFNRLVSDEKTPMRAHSPNASSWVDDV